jgi:NAD(P)-dependent dehydrogenase (short-subunit alcohol dehydrogenase family)
MRVIRGKIALVTGAASGIGRALALRLAQEGAQLFLLDVDGRGLGEVVSAARQYGVEVKGVRCDVTQPDQVDRCIDRLLSSWGHVDILVNNAGVTYYGHSHHMSAEHWGQLLAVNLHGPIHFTRRLLPALLSRPEGHILNVASICGLVGMGRVAAYTTSKFALVGFSESLRAEYGRRGLGITAFCPGLVDTKLFASASRGEDRRENKRPPKFLLVSPEKIANRAVKAIYRNQAVVVMQPYARLLYATKRFSPWILDRINHFSRRKLKVSCRVTDCPEVVMNTPRKAA